MSARGPKTYSMNTLTERSLRLEVILPADGWAIVQFLWELGADDFSVRVIEGDEEHNEAWADKVLAKLSPFLIGRRHRECTVSYSGPELVGDFLVWRLDQSSIALLTELLPDGIKGITWAIEDLCVYRAGDLVLGTVTHEHEAFVRLYDDEWNRWSDVGFDRYLRGQPL